MLKRFIHLSVRSDQNRPSTAPTWRAVTSGEPRPRQSRRDAFASTCRDGVGAPLGAKDPARAGIGVSAVQTPGRRELAHGRATSRSAARGNFLLRAQRDEAAARRFLERAIDLHGVPERRSPSVRQESWRGPAGESPAQVRGSARLVASVASCSATATTKRTQRSCGVWE